MNDKEIRLLILSTFYKVAKEGKWYISKNEDKELVKIPDNEYEFNCYYLIQKYLLEGDVSTASGGSVYTTVSRISASGIDVIDDLVDKSIENLQKEEGLKIEESISTTEKFMKFYDRCVGGSSMCQFALNMLDKILTNI